MGRSSGNHRASVAAVPGRARQGVRESLLLLSLAVAIFLLVALLSYDAGDPAWSRSGVSEATRNLGGVAGAWTADILLFFLGYPAFLLPILLAIGAWLAYRRHTVGTILGPRSLGLRALGLVLTVTSGCGLAGLFLPPNPGLLPGAPGGALGALTGSSLSPVFGYFGAGLFLIALFLTGLNLLTGLSWLRVLDATGRLSIAASCVTVRAVGMLITRVREQRRRRAAAVPERAAPETVDRAPARVEPELDKFDDAPTAERVLEALPSGSAAAPSRERVASANLSKSRQRATSSDSAQVEMQLLNLPPMDLLDLARDNEGGYTAEVLESLSRKVEEKLHDFGIEVAVVNVQPGPVITRFELQPAPGVKVSQITNLAKDLARGLSVIAVRVVEVIPGKTVIGLEIPNNKREIVYLREVLNSRLYREATSPLTLVLGKDIAGNPTAADLARMPHLLVAGTTGAGKSVAINAMLLSMLYKSTPSDVRLILIDPKMLELSVYEGIPHLLTPVVTDMKEAASALRWCVAEMERRYRLLAAFKVRNIGGFNRRVREAAAAGEPLTNPFFEPHKFPEGAAPPELETLPFIVVVIDELADMMMVVGKKVEELIARLAQKARASGIHLIIATQRPSVDVITGLIKANIPSRIAFQVSSKVDSRTILDQMGAETLLGHGDMLYLPPGTGFPSRLHGAFVDDHEVNAVAEFLKSTGTPDYVDHLLDHDGGDLAGAIGAEHDDPESDELYDQAVRIVTETRRASASGIQRRLKIGYNRAARLIEAMEVAGIVSAQQSNGMREVMAPPPAGSEG